MQCPDSRRDFITHHQGPPGVRWILRGWSHQVKCQSRGSSEGDWQQRASGEGPEPEGAGNQCSQSPSSQVLRTQACALTWFMKRPCDSQLTRLCSESRARAVREPSPNTRPVSKAGPPEFPPLLLQLSQEAPCDPRNTGQRHAPLPQTWKLRLRRPRAQGHMWGWQGLLGADSVCLPNLPVICLEHPPT